MKKQITDALIRDHIQYNFNINALIDLQNKFSMYGFVRLNDIVSKEVKKIIREEVLLVLDRNSERRDLKLKTTGNTPRKMKVVKSNVISENCPNISELSKNDFMLKFLEEISREKLYNKVKQWLKHEHIRFKLVIKPNFIFGYTPRHPGACSYSLVSQWGYFWVQEDFPVF